MPFLICGAETMIWKEKERSRIRTTDGQPKRMLYPSRTTFPLFAVPSVPSGTLVGTSALRIPINWLS